MGRDSGIGIVTPASVRTVRRPRAMHRSASKGRASTARRVTKHWAWGRGQYRYSNPRRSSPFYRERGDT